MKLNVMERLNVLSVLPKESDFATLKIVRVLQDSVGFGEAEWKEYGIKQKDGSTTWNPEKGSEEKEIEIGEKATDVIKEAFKELNNKKKLTAQHLSVYEKFMEE